MMIMCSVSTYEFNRLMEFFVKLCFQVALSFLWFLEFAFRFACHFRAGVLVSYDASMKPEDRKARTMAKEAIKQGAQPKKRGGKGRQFSSLLVLGLDGYRLNLVLILVLLPCFRIYARCSAVTPPPASRSNQEQEQEMDFVQNLGSDEEPLPSHSPLIGSSGAQGDSKAPLTQGTGEVEKTFQLEDHRKYFTFLPTFFFSLFTFFLVEGIVFGEVILSNSPPFC